MKITFHNSSAASDPAFARLVRDECGVVLERCYQCLTCTLGCDAAGAMDLMPHEIVRLTHLGMRDRVLGCRSIWVCTSCEACVARCPNEIDIPHLMDTLHQIAAQEGFVSSEPAVPAFH
ncbi:MAG: heterodisulfide reductase subunit C, partial [Deltaproteobacteria bacterium]|nr:heterodisulfide reductase subunit C [Deltaproteobacteria bacterium]